MSFPQKNAIDRVDGFTWKMGAEARQGIDRAALILSRALVRGGFFAHANLEYGSIVTGGNLSFELRMSTKPVQSLSGQSNLLIAKDERTVLMWADEILPGGGLIVDAEDVNLGPYKKKLQQKKVEIFHVPFLRLLNENLLPEQTHNAAMLGALVGLICFDLKTLQHSLRDVFKERDPKNVKNYLKAAKLAYDYVLSNYEHKYYCQPRPKKSDHFLMEGNEGMIMGALKAGMTSYSGYAMTPISGILHYGALLKKRYDIFVYMPEDEISACLFGIGASLAGARSMTGTSGGGFALMSESIGLSAMTETPLVLAMGQRAGPSTGIATRHGQGDLRFVMHASQEQPPRVVLTPADPQDVFELTFHAFYIAEKYQTLVIILTDKYLQESFWTQAPIKHKHLKVQRGKILSPAQISKLKKYSRYKVTKDGISPLVHPGSSNPNVIWRTSSSEHDKNGFTSENRANRIEQMDKRERKLKTAYTDYIKKIEPVQSFGPTKANVVVITFGSSKGPILDAIASLGSGAKVKLIVIRCVLPFPQSELKAALKNAKKVLFVEGNQDGQLEGVIKEQTGISAAGHLRFYDGRPVTFVKVANFLKKYL